MSSTWQKMYYDRLCMTNVLKEAVAVAAPAAAVTATAKRRKTEKKEMYMKIGADLTHNSIKINKYISSLR